jgi:hypothetical protein
VSKRVKWVSERERGAEKNYPQQFFFIRIQKKCVCICMCRFQCVCVCNFFLHCIHIHKYSSKKKSTIKIRPWRNNNIKSNNNMWKNILKINEKWIALYAGCSLHQPVKKLKTFFAVHSALRHENQPSHKIYCRKKQAIIW